MFQVQVLKPYEFVQEPSQKVLFIKARQLASIEAQRAAWIPWLDSSLTDKYLSRFMKLKFSSLFFIKSVIICFGFLFSQP